MSAIDQYCEAIPSPAGDRGNTDPDRGGLPIPAASQRALARQGADGRAIIGLSAASGKPGQRGNSAGPASAIGPDRPAQALASNPITALADGVSAGATVGPLLGTAMLILALVFLSTAWLRYRRRTQS